MTSEHPRAVEGQSAWRHQGVEGRMPTRTASRTIAFLTIIDNSGGKFVTNAKMAEYPKLAKSYGLPVPSGTCR
jgi:hypothetical protein